MNANRSRVVISAGPRECWSIHATHIYHCDFPERWVQGETLHDAAERLERELSAELDCASSNLHRRQLVQALADTRAFLRQLDEKGLSLQPSG